LLRLRGRGRRQAALALRFGRFFEVLGESVKTAPQLADVRRRFRWPIEDRRIVDNARRACAVMLHDEATSSIKVGPNSLTAGDGGRQRPLDATSLCGSGSASTRDKAKPIGSRAASE
jgi:hypothetical protein